MDSWISEKHVIQLHDTKLIYKIKNIAWGKNSWNGLQIGLREQETSVSQREGLSGRQLIRRAQTFGLPMYVHESCMQDFWRI